MLIGEINALGVDYMTVPVEFKVDRIVEVPDVGTLLIGSNPFGKNQPRDLIGLALIVDGQLRSIKRGSLSASLQIDGQMYSLFQNNKIAIELDPIKLDESPPIAISASYVASLERALSEYVRLGNGKCVIGAPLVAMGRAALNRETEQ